MSPAESDRQPGRRLGPRLREARERRGLTQQELATRANVKLDTLRAIEQGRVQNPGVFTLLGLVRELDVSIDWLIQGTHPGN